MKLCSYQLATYLLTYLLTTSKGSRHALPSDPEVTAVTVAGTESVIQTLPKHVGE